MSRTIVVPTLGRPSLTRLLAALSGESVVVVDDRDDVAEPLVVPVEARVVVGPRRGPAAARNRGWRSVAAEWIVFMDDDVVPGPGWREALDADLRTAAAASQARLERTGAVHRRPSRRSGAAEPGRRATADIAYRREALELTGGFDERFPWGWREDTDLALRLVTAGLHLESGRRRTYYPAGSEDAGVRVAWELGAAADLILRAVYGDQPHDRRPRRPPG